jgi:DNA-binding NtrC family response regulator
MSLTTSVQVPPGEAWRAIGRLLARLRFVAERGDWLSECLDNLVTLVDADRGLVVVHRGATDHVVQARGAGRQLSTAERLEVSQTLIRAAHDQRRLTTWQLGDDGATESLASLRIVAAVAVPLFGVGTEQASEPVGALYLDYRRPRRALDDTVLELLATAGDIVSVVMNRQFALERAHRHLADARASEQSPSLEELLAPPSMAALQREVDSLGHDTPVLITGESGTGKTLLCQGLAAATGGPVVRALLGSSDDLNTITSELFGHERGAFSGATRRRVGMAEQADGGTLILDEVLNLPLHAQQLLLDLTQFGTFRPLGWVGAQPKTTRVRIIAATNGDLERAVAEGRFRQDLYFRLSGAHLRLPPLRERRQDIVPLAQALIARCDPDRPWQLSLELRRGLSAEHLEWPGNIRQLAMVVRRMRERALAEDADAERVELRHLGDLLTATLPRREASGDEPPSAQPADYAELNRRRAALDDAERQLIEASLSTHGGVVARVARDLGLARTSLLSRMQTLGIEREAGKPGRPRGSDEPLSR